ncbi:MAG: hypothetical protein RBT71_07320 [Flavobacteriales bacterium]|jgi:hypothetical protein|nr:hypothetical protein [Flavobacteriales bacterium]
MPTRTPDHPFAPGGPVSRELLEAYAAGRCDPDQRHAVERAMEADPLLRDAMDGLHLPGAIEALRTLRPPPPGPPPPPSRGRTLLVVVGALLLGGTWLVVSPMMERPAPVAPERPLRPTMPTAPAPVEALPPMEVAEVMEAEERPANERIGHAADERHHEAMRHMVERTSIDRMEARAPDTATPPRTAPRPVPAHRPSRQLVFLHGYKLVHPDELHPYEPVLHQWQGHTPAAHADHDARNAATGQVRTMAYLPFMDAAMARFHAHDHKAALVELLFVLDQYPDDVNALFYAGLCAYNLGAYARAENFLAQAATHRIDTFDEEARWYHALTLEQLGDHAGARQAFARIAAGGGFYAERAGER